MAVSWATYVPGSAYVCVVCATVAFAPSPKSQAAASALESPSGSLAVPLSVTGTPHGVVTSGPASTIGGALTLTVTVATFEFIQPSKALNVNESGPAYPDSGVYVADAAAVGRGGAVGGLRHDREGQLLAGVGVGRRERNLLRGACLDDLAGRPGLRLRPVVESLPRGR